MRHLKMLGLAAIAAMGLLAFVGAGSASATTLCTTADTPGCTMTYTSGTVIDASLKAGGTARLTSGGTTVATCTGGTVKGKTTVTSGTVVTGNIEELTWTGCNQTTDTIATGSLEIEWISGTHNGTVKGKGSQVTLNVFGTTCTYGTGEGTHLGTLTGGEAPVLAISTTVKKTAGNFLCPSTAGWDAEYIVTEPHSLFVVG